MNEFGEFCYVHGICRQYYVTDAPHRVVERVNHLLMDYARSILRIAGLEKF